MSSQLNVVNFDRDALGSITVRIDGETSVEIPVLTSDVLVYPVTGDVTGDVTGTVTTANSAGPHTVDWVDSSGTPGDCTCSSISGKVAIALGDDEVVVTNTLASAGDLVFVTMLNIDATCTVLKAVATENTITITGNATATAALYLNFLLLKIADVTPE